MSFTCQVVYRLPKVFRAQVRAGIAQGNTHLRYYNSTVLLVTALLTR